MLLDGCHFRSNSADFAGGAVSTYESSIIMKDCLFDGNGEESMIFGGACYLRYSQAEMTNCFVRDSYGEATITLDESDGLIQSSIFSNNFGTAVEGFYKTINITDSLFLNNYAEYRSGGVYFSGSVEAILSNCVFSGNSGHYASAVACRQEASLEAVNCLFSENGLGNGTFYFEVGSASLRNCTLFSNQTVGIYMASSPDVSVRNTFFWGNSNGSYNVAEDLDIQFSCLPETIGTNNIHIDPKGVSETGALLPNSPCIDRGSDSTTSDFDIYGTSRWDHPWRSNGVDASTADIGAVEFIDSDTDTDGLGDLWEIHYFTNTTFTSGTVDHDSDGLSTTLEYRYNTDPTAVDTDGDGLSDSAEVNTHGTDPLNEDSDRDGLTDTDEINTHGTDPLDADSDEDGLPDGWEISNSLDPMLGSDALIDADSDGLNNLEEYTLGTDFQDNDSDNDGMPDGWETVNSLNPLTDDSAADPDSDGISNLAEYQAQTDPQDMDSDDDGMPNAWETAHGLDLNIDDATGDADGDNLSNLQEYQAGSDPNAEDSDADRLSDWDEVNVYQTNPALKDTDGDGVDDWFELDQGRDPLLDESASPENPLEGLLAMPLSYSGSILAADFDDDGQLNVDELHRYPTFGVRTYVSWGPLAEPPEFLFDDAIVKRDAWVDTIVVSGSMILGKYFTQTFYAEPGAEYSLVDILAVEGGHNPVLFTSAHIAWSGGDSLMAYTTNHIGTFIYPYSCNYRIERSADGAYGRKMETIISDTSDTNEMGLVVFEQMTIHANAPSPTVYLSASPEVQLRRASSGALINSHQRGNVWHGTASNPPPPLPPTETEDPPLEDLFIELCAGELAILVEGLSPSKEPDMTADNVADYHAFPTYYSPENPTSDGEWGTYVGLCFRDAIDRYEWFENDAIRFSVEVKPNIALIPDWNRDRQINSTDEDELTNSLPYRFWINDDHDSGDIAEGDSDIPGRGGLFSGANYEDSVVNGRSDLTDFFPVWLRLESALTNYPPVDGVEYRLSHAGKALRFVYTDLVRTNAGDYLVSTNVTSCGPAFNQNVYEADSEKIPNDGVALNSAFLSRVAANPNKGVLLMESTASTAYPLVLEVVSNNTVLCEAELPMRTSSVEFMFHHKNLREDGFGMPDRDASVAINELPSNGKNFIFVHGYNVSAQAARGWQSEIFKRMFWSGSNARFHGITWHGDRGSKANYQENVSSAFKTAPHLKDYVSSISGTKIMLAHSLGNMVVSSAIEDHGVSVSKYLMLGAAVAAEAYDATTFNDSTNSNPMLPEDWDGYESQTFSANFHELYSSPDKRSELTWQSRFENVVSVAYNFYSSEDEVFEIHPSVTFLSGFDLNLTLSRYVWQKQEVFKGCDSWFPLSFGSTKWWGWGFNRNLLGFKEYSASEANALTDIQLRQEPVFRYGRPAEAYVRVNNLDDEAVNEMLAMGLPAMSPSAGQVPITPIQNNGGGNFDISTWKQNGWPRNEQPYLQRWLHSDCKDVAYLYTQELFVQLVTEGGLK